MTEPRRIAIYGGTFDPIHHAHLILAREATEQLDLARVIFVPAARSPFKPNDETAPADDRLAMLRAAVAHEPQFEIDDLELRRPAPSYSIDTVVEFASRNPTARPFFLVGEDNVLALPSWHRWAELREMAEFVVLERTGTHPVHSYRAIRRHVDISATQIRNRVASGRSIRYLVPEAVAEIIHARGLYKERPNHA